MDPVGACVFGVGLLMMGVTIHYVKNQVAGGAISRNSAIGIRTKATMASDRAWEAGHAAAGPMLTATCLTAYTAGVLTVAIGLASTLGDVGKAVAIVVPLCGVGAVLTLLSTAAIKANSAARATGESGA